MIGLVGTISVDDVAVNGLAPEATLAVGGFSALFLALGVVALVAAAASGTKGDGVVAVYFGGGIAVLAAAFMMFALVRTRRPLALVGGRLRVRSLASTRWLPLAELTGVGLVFSYTGGRGKAASWCLGLWGADGDLRKVAGTDYLVSWTAQQYRQVAAQPPQTPDQLAATDPGRLAQRIYELAAEAQGPEGPLETAQAQKFASSGAWSKAPGVVACWSPGGSIARTGTP
jgi:hypothetical protein